MVITLSIHRAITYDPALSIFAILAIVFVQFRMTWYDRFRKISIQLRTIRFLAISIESRSLSNFVCRFVL